MAELARLCLDGNCMENTDANAFSTFKVGSTNVVADSTQDTLELVAGLGMVLTPDATNDKITIANKQLSMLSNEGVFNIAIANKGYGGISITLPAETSTAYYAVYGAVKFPAGTSAGGNDYYCWLANTATPSKAFWGDTAVYHTYNLECRLNATALISYEPEEGAQTIAVYGNINNSMLNGCQGFIRALKIQ